ncbi:hypothetical protein GCM10010277_61970 [Streptomyces longisporoflavus]|nr:hypothetical protein GCM10010277_61970 [Streptomyces longisporoflavus]
MALPGLGWWTAAGSRVCGECELRGAGCAVLVARRTEGLESAFSCALFSVGSALTGGQWVGRAWREKGVTASYRQTRWYESACAGEGFRAGKHSRTEVAAAVSQPCRSRGGAVWLFQ